MDGSQAQHTDVGRSDRVTARLVVDVSAQLTEELKTGLSANPVGDVNILPTDLVLAFVSEELGGIDVAMIRDKVSANLLSNVPKNPPSFVTGNVSASLNRYVIASLLDKVTDMVFGRPSPIRELECLAWLGSGLKRVLPRQSGPNHHMERAIRGSKAPRH